MIKTMNVGVPVVKKFLSCTSDPLLGALLLSLILFKDASFTIPFLNLIRFSAVCIQF